MSSRTSDSFRLPLLLAASLMLVGLGALYTVRRRAEFERERGMLRATEAALARAERSIRRAEEAPPFQGEIQTPSSRAAEWLEREEPWKARLEGLDRQGVLRLGAEILGWDPDEYDREEIGVEKLREWFLQDQRWRNTADTGYSAA